MIPGELFIKDGEIELNAGRKTVTLTVANTGDRPIQVGSHYHFFETNPALKFERKKARGLRLDIAAGTAVRNASSSGCDISSALSSVSANSMPAMEFAVRSGVSTIATPSASGMGRLACKGGGYSVS